MRIQESRIIHRFNVFITQQNEKLYILSLNTCPINECGADDSDNKIKFK